MLLAVALTVASTVPPPPAPPPAAEIEQVADGRVAADTFVNGAGPFRFVIDTGANRTAVSNGLAKRLALPSDGEADVLGVTGSITAPMVRIESLTAGSLRVENLSAPTVGSGALGAHDGLLAVRDLSGARLTLDFEQDLVTLEPSPARSRRPHHSVMLPAQFAAEGIIKIPVEIGGVNAVAVLDTGAQFTMINGPLLEALERRARAKRTTTAWISSIAAETTSGYVVRMPILSVAGVSFEGYNALAVDDLYVLREWGLAETPAMILGMNIMRAMNSLTIDFPAQKVYFTFDGKHVLASRRERRVMR